MTATTEITEARTLKELLVSIRGGYVLHRPVLVEVDTRQRGERGEQTFERTMTLTEPVNWVESHGREYANSKFIVLGPNTLHAGTDVPVTIGRSRRCDVRIENDSVSKVHVSLTFDRATGEYFLVDENSRNGTFINGATVEPGARAQVWSGAYVCFGDAIYVFLDPPTLRQLARLMV